MAAGDQTKTLLSHEHASIPTSIFDKDGYMREAKSKAELKNLLRLKQHTLECRSKLMSFSWMAVLYFMLTSGPVEQCKSTWTTSTATCRSAYLKVMWTYYLTGNATF